MELITRARTNLAVILVSSDVVDPSNWSDEKTKEYFQQSNDKTKEYFQQAADLGLVDVVQL